VFDYKCSSDRSIWPNNDCGISSWKWKSAKIYLQINYALAIHLPLQQDLYNVIAVIFGLIVYTSVSQTIVLGQLPDREMQLAL
jgi:hypothetical protein